MAHSLSLVNKKIAIPAILLVLVVTFPSLGTAQVGEQVAPCALTIRARTPDMRPVRLAFVSLVNSEGETVAREEIRDGVARFCDFGFGDHSIILNRGRCGEVRVGYIRIDYRRQQTFDVVYPVCLEPQVWASCLYFLRATSNSGIPIASARLTKEDGTVVTSADQFGRMIARIEIGSSPVAVVRSGGYDEKVINLPCVTPSSSIGVDIKLSE